MTHENIQSIENVTAIEVPPHKWEKWRDARLAALQNDPQAFGGVFENENERSPEDWQQKFARPNQILCAAEYNGVFASIAGAYKSEGENWNIISVHTAPEFRGKGLSKKVLLHVIDIAKTKGAETISLTVNTQQESAVGLYTKLGFEIVGTEKDQEMGNGELCDEYVMEMSC